jgi:hypothetical protein
MSRAGNLYNVSSIAYIYPADVYTQGHERAVANV